MNGIYSALKNRAAGGQYVPAEMVSKIDTAWAEGKISDAQPAELTNLTQTCADPNYSPMTQGERALDERLFAVEAAMLDVGMLLAEIMGGMG